MEQVEQNETKQQRTSPFVRLREIDKNAPIQREILETYNNIKAEIKKHNLALNISYYNELTTKVNELIQQQQDSEKGLSATPVSLDNLQELVKEFGLKSAQEEYKSQSKNRTQKNVEKPQEEIVKNNELMTEILVLKEQVSQVLSLANQMAEVLLNQNQNQNQNEEAKKISSYTETIFEQFKEENERNSFNNK